MPKSFKKKSKNGGSRKAPSPTFAAASSSSSGDFLSKLTLLREFITGCGVGHQYSERDLSACLRRSGLNVEAAAEQLLTGQWKSEDSPTNNGGVFSFEASSVPSSASASASVSSSSKPPSVSGTSTGGSAGRRKVTPSPPDSSKRRRISGNSGGNSGKSAAKASSSLARTSSGGKSSPTQQHFLLCRRWMVGLSTSRSGRIRHGEKLHLTASSSGPPIVRFRGSNVEGTLPQEESSMLTPLLRHVCDGSKLPTNLISISAEALMEDTGLVIGSEVPLSLSVHIDQPAQFFDLFSAATSAADTKPGGNDWLSKKISSKKKHKQMPPLAAAAFRLLQWAQYGNVPSFTPANNTTDSSGDSYKEDGDNGSSSDDVGGNDNDCQGATFVDEEQFSQPDEEEDAPDWANSIIDNIGADDSQERPSETSTSMNVAVQLPEESDPEGLRSDITLHPYQRQALHWMLRREDDSPDRNDLTKEMELLAELASTSGTAAVAGGSAPAPYLGGSKAITCDCGPVLVSEEMATESVTIHGNIDPVQHPLWQRRFLTTDGFSSAVSFYVNEVLGVATSRPPNPPRQCVGGILADSMGLGKTVMLLSLIMKSKEKRIGTAPSTDKPIKRKPIDTSRDEQSDGPNETIDMLSSEDESDDADDEDYTPGSDSQRKMASLEMKSSHSEKHTTLVVAPLSLVLQWEEEISTKTDLSCLVYYGNTRAATSSGSFRGVDVVLTTYGTLQTEYLQSTSPSPKGVKPTTLLSHQWERVIVDEAHHIKNPGTAVSKSCCSIIAAKRWAVTGTPIQNSLQDVYGLLKFLKHEPWCNHAFWKTAITTTEPTSDGTAPSAATTTSEHHGMSLAMDRVRRILHPLILRRTKETVGADGKPILTLPPIDFSVVSVHFTEPEREFYTALLDKSQHVFEGLLKAGTASKSWLAIFSLLQRLRQSCDHVALTVKPRFTDPASAAPASETSDDQEDSTSDETAVNKSFLSNLLQMFAKQANKSNGDQQPAPSSPSRSPVKATETGEPSSAFISQVVQSLTESVDDGGKIKEECPLCLDCPDISSAVLTPCAHTMCLDCLRPVLKQSAYTSKQGGTSTPQCRNALSLKDGPCPVCSAHVEASRIVSFSRSEESGDVIISQFVGDIPMPEGADSSNMNMDPTAASARETLLASLSGGESSKLAAVKRELNAIWKLDGGSKVLIFSQYLGFLDILGISLRKESIPVFRLDGEMSLKERVAALDRFNKAKSTSTRCTGDTEEEEIIRGSVFLASMKAGGVGINLVAASSVFIVDPWWNAAIEDQCINRIHRIGQKAPIVRVRKFVVNDSVEEKIIRLQQTKKSMATDILDASADGTDASSGSKPTLEDFKILLGR